MRSIFVSVRQGKLAKWQNDFLNEAMRWIFAVMIVLRYSRYRAHYIRYCAIYTLIWFFNSLSATGDLGRQPPLLPPRLRATTVDTIIHNYRLSAAP